MNNLEIKTFIVKPLSPILIKSGMAETNYGQGAIRIGDKVYIIDAQKLQSELFRTFGLKIVEDFTEKFIENQNNFNIKRFLDEKGYDYKSNINLISKSIISSIRRNSNLFTSTGLNKYFIPGSSIKGAIRTAILYKLVDKNYIVELLKDKLRQYKEKQGRDRKKFKEKFAKELILKYLQNTNSDDGNNERYQYSNEDNGPYMDFLKAVKVSDSLTLENISRGRIKIMVFGNNIPKWKTNNRGDIEINTEFLFENAEITISLDKDILNSFSKNKNVKFSSLDDIIKICSEFSMEQLKYEKDFYKNINSEPFVKIKNFYNNEIKPTLRLGWGTGLLGTTVDLLLSEESRQQLRNEVLGHNRNNQPAPKSRRILIDKHGNLYPLGWIQLIEKYKVESSEIKMKENISLNSSLKSGNYAKPQDTY